MRLRAEEDAHGGAWRRTMRVVVGGGARGSGSRATSRRLAAQGDGAGIAEARVRGRQVPVPLRAVLTLMRVHGNLM